MNAIITGPNAGGKSTFIKSLLINILFAQTTTICLASEFKLCPFDIINSQINVPDNKGHASLFEAEMYRCKNNLDLLKQHPEKKTLIVLDEMFSSTNPVEGIAGAFAIAKRLAHTDNCLLIFTTHFTYLTKLAKATGRFINFKMNVKYEQQGMIYPYKLEQGISKQYIALELLEKNGFDQDIINDALELKTRFIT
jgi:DNA mismatch repair protein MutS